MIARRFTRQQRLTQAGDFTKVFQQPERRSDNLFTILYIPNGLDIGRLGLAIAKKRARRAVDRNRIKRLIRESFRQHQDILVGKDIIVLVRDHTSTTDNASLMKALHGHWQRLK